MQATINLSNEQKMYIRTLRGECKNGSAKAKAESKSQLLKTLVKLNVFDKKEVKEIEALVLGTHVFAPNSHSHNQIDQILSKKIDALV